MSRPSLLLTTLLALGGASVAHAQNTTVQLPTFNFTTVQTTVSVPDSGTGYLGGIMRGAEGSNARGVPLLSNVPGLNRLFRNQAIGREFSNSNFTVVPRIIIQEEEEFRQTGVSPETLAIYESQRMQAAGVDPQIAGKADFLSRNLARHEPPRAINPPKSSLPSADEIRRRQALAQQQEAAEAVEFFAKGEQAVAEGKPGVAKIYYQMAARRATGSLHVQVTERLASLASAKSATKLASQ
jgi:hypothetical protein